MSLHNILYEVILDWFCAGYIIVCECYGRLYSLLLIQSSCCSIGPRVIMDSAIGVGRLPSVPVLRMHITFLVRYMLAIEHGFLVICHTVV